MIPVVSERPLRILFVCQDDPRVASEKQAIGFAQALVGAGHAAMLSFHGSPEAARAEGIYDLAGVEFHLRHHRGPRVDSASLAAAREFAPDFVHAWNARAAVDVPARQYLRATGARPAVHWEDDEWSIRRGAGRLSPARRVARLGRRILAPVIPRHGLFVTPAALRRIARPDVAHDALTPALAARVSEALGVQCAALLPIVPALPARAGRLPPLPEGRQLVALTGTVHPGSVGDLELSLQAVARLQREGRPVTLVHAGTALARYDLPRLAQQAGVEPGGAVFLGYLPLAQVPHLLARVAVALQPGRPNDFNRLRLPSKVESYLAAATPTVTYAVGFAELLADGEEVLKLQGYDAEELAGAIGRILDDPALAGRLAAGGRAAHDRLFDPRRNLDALVAHYRTRLTIT